VAIEFVVELETTDVAEVVALGVEEQVVEKILRLLDRGRIAGAKSLIDLEDTFLGRGDLVGKQRVAQIGTNVNVVDEQDVDRVDAAAEQFFERGFFEVFVTFNDDLTGFHVVDVFGGDFVQKLFTRNGNACDSGFGQT